MGCTLAALIACFGWSGFYVDGGLLYQDAGYQESWTGRQSIYEWNGYSYIFDRVENRKLSISHAENPYGRLALGYEISLPSVTWRIEASHVSSLATGQDRGINALSLSARWYPFRNH